MARKWQRVNHLNSHLLSMRMIAGQNVCRYLRITILNAALPGPDGIRRIL